MSRGGVKPRQTRDDLTNWPDRVASRSATTVGLNDTQPCGRALCRGQWTRTDVDAHSSVAKSAYRNAR